MKGGGSLRRVMNEENGSRESWFGRWSRARLPFNWCFRLL